MELVRIARAARSCDSFREALKLGFQSGRQMAISVQRHKLR
jgi:hypothetical protein